MEKENENYPETLQECSDELREGMAEEEVRDDARERSMDRLKVECERDAKFAIAQYKMMQPLYDLLIPKIK